jgi:hypothetical protein
MVKRFKVSIPEPEWEESHSALEDLADVEIGVPHKGTPAEILMKPRASKGIASRGRSVK